MTLFSRFTQIIFLLTIILGCSVKDSDLPNSGKLRLKKELITNGNHRSTTTYFYDNNNKLVRVNSTGNLPNENFTQVLYYDAKYIYENELLKEVQYDYISSKTDDLQHLYKYDSKKRITEITTFKLNSTNSLVRKAFYSYKDNFILEKVTDSWLNTVRTVTQVFDSNGNQSKLLTEDYDNSVVLFSNEGTFEFDTKVNPYPSQIYSPLINNKNNVTRFIWKTNYHTGLPNQNVITKSINQTFEYLYQHNSQNLPTKLILKELGFNQEQISTFEYESYQ